MSYSILSIETSARLVSREYSKKATHVCTLRPLSALMHVLVKPVGFGGSVVTRGTVTVTGLLRGTLTPSALTPAHYEGAVGRWGVWLGGVVGRWGV